MSAETYRYLPAVDPDQTALAFGEHVHAGIVWVECPKHARIAMTDAMIRDLISSPICPAPDPEGRMGVCGRRVTLIRDAETGSDGG